MFKLPHVIQKLLNRFGVDFLVLGLYLILTLILLYPFSPLQMGKQLIGNTADTYQNLWNLWWVKQSALSLQNPYTTNFIFYPYGADLYVHTLSPAAGFLTIPFQLTAGVVFSYNLLMIVSFVLGGYGSYRLALHLTHDRKASFFAGLVFTFSTYHFAKALANLNLSTIQWLPLYVLFLLKMRNEKSPKNILAAITFLTLNALMADLQYVLFLALFTMLFVIYEFAFDRRQIIGFLKRLSLTSAAFCAVMFLVFSPLIVGSFTGKYTYAMDSQEFSVGSSGDLLAFFTPSRFTPLFGPAVHGINQAFITTNLYPIEGNTFLGFTVLALTIYAAYKLRKEAKFWLISAVVFAVLALGPVLHVLGTTPFNFPMPEAVIGYFVPFFRAPSRLVVMTTLSLAVVAAIVLKHVSGRLSRLEHGKVLSVLFIVLLSATVLAENNFLPYSVAQDTTVSPFYYQLAQMPESFSVLDLPQNYSQTNLYMYYGTISQKPLLGGSISHYSPREILLREAVPLVTQTGFAVEGKNPMEYTDIITQNYNLTNLYALEYFNVKYVILHKDQMSTKAYQTMANYLNTLLGAPCYDDKTITAYEVKRTVKQGIYAYLTDNWYGVEAQKGWATRWIKTNGKIQILSPQTQFCNVNFTVGTQYTNKTLTLNLNNQLVGTYRILTLQPRQIALTLRLNVGINELSFFCNQTHIPPQYSNDTTDSRVLSVYIKNVQIG